MYLQWWWFEDFRVEETVLYGTVRSGEKDMEKREDGGFIRESGWSP